MNADGLSWKRFAAAVIALALGTGCASAATCRAIDGDTLICGRQKVRLANVYAAELAEPGGAVAKARLAALVRGANVAITHVARDKYGRTIAQVSVGGRVISQADIGARAGVGADYAPRQRLARAYRPHTSIKLAPQRTVKYHRTQAPSRPLQFSSVAKKPRHSTNVRPYVRRDGRYVSGHHRRG